MKIVYRFGFFFGGFSIGLVFLMFFLSGKKTSCAYGPDARVLKNIQIKSIRYSESVQELLNTNKIDTLTLNSIFKGADINFGESDTKSTPCKTYRVVGDLYEMDVENCERVATIKTLIAR
ncbi:hypothetical protein N8836_01575 [Flavobacteriaceae bacterium]|jgi:hypothetical protein|nr:hypothetical protein [Flavobacteriaceae bacterium]MDA7724272.1 hypothetical protein [Flavobacteriaceae bacterium]MDA7848545.1 hypothetical protein [Flavobacteriaceae bacterium]|tara:strand:+ start:27130 stop:27489 length:360 start_codon:yes stop_codon:yes gene_type:complete